MMRLKRNRGQDANEKESWRQKNYKIGGKKYKIGGKRQLTAAISLTEICFLFIWSETGAAIFRNRKNLTEIKESSS